MSRASQVIILCEDKAHEMFVTRFLKSGWKLNPRAIRIVDYPAKGRGSGKQHVKTKLEREVKAYRTRSASTVLIAIIDADENTVDDVRREMEGISGRTNEEQIAFIIPKWHIETWLAFLDTGFADEDVSYKNQYGEIAEKGKEVRRLVEALSKTCRGQEDMVSPPDSLLKACEEFGRIRDFLSS